MMEYNPIIEVYYDKKS